MDIGISTLVDLDVDFAELARMIRDAGFTHLSLSHDVEHSGYHLPPRRAEIKQLFSGLGLKLDYIHAPIQHYYDLTSLDPQVRRLTLEVLKLCCDAASELGGEGVVTHLMNGPLGAGERVAQRVAAGLAALEELLDYAAQRRVLVYAENLPLDIDCGVVSLELIRAAADPRLRLCLDSCHARIKNEQYLALVEELAPRVGATHLSDTLGELDSHLIPGEGAVDFAAVSTTLGRAGFHGVIDLECSVWMQRKRLQAGKPHAGDTPLRSTEQFLSDCAAAARRIASGISAAHT